MRVFAQDQNDVRLISYDVVNAWGFLPRIKTMLGWSVTMWSMHEGVFPGSKFVCSAITWDKPREVSISSISRPSRVLSPSGHQKWDLALKYPAKNIAKGFSALIFEYKFLKLSRKAWNSWDVWLKEGLRFSYDQILTLPLSTPQRTNRDEY